MEKEISIVGSEENPVVVLLKEFKGRKGLDIRKYYSDSGDLKPTRKGLFLNKIQFSLIKKIINERENEILSWFDNDFDEVKHKIGIQIDASSINNYKTIKSIGKQDSWKGYGFFEVVFEGSKSTVKLNKAHPWVKDFLTSVDKHQFSLLIDLLSAFSQSINLLNINDEHSRELLDSLVFNWGLILKKILTKKTNA